MKKSAGFLWKKRLPQEAVLSYKAVALARVAMPQKEVLFRSGELLIVVNLQQPQPESRQHRQAMWREIVSHSLHAADLRPYVDGVSAVRMRISQRSQEAEACLSRLMFQPLGGDGCSYERLLWVNGLPVALCAGRHSSEARHAGAAPALSTSALHPVSYRVQSSNAYLADMSGLHKALKHRVCPEALAALLLRERLSPGGDSGGGADAHLLARPPKLSRNAAYLFLRYSSSPAWSVYYPLLLQSLSLQERGQPQRRVLQRLDNFEEALTAFEERFCCPALHGCSGSRELDQVLQLLIPLCAALFGPGRTPWRKVVVEREISVDSAQRHLPLFFDGASGCLSVFTQLDDRLLLKSELLRGVLWALADALCIRPEQRLAYRRMAMEELLRALPAHNGLTCEGEVLSQLASSCSTVTLYLDDLNLGDSPEGVRLPIRESSGLEASTPIGAPLGAASDLSSLQLKLEFKLHRIYAPEDWYLLQ